MQEQIVRLIADYRDEPNENAPMKWRHIKYLSAYLVPLVVIFSIFKGGYFSFTAVIFLFGFIPLIELFTSVNDKNLGSIEDEMAKEDKWFDYLLYGLAPFQFLVLIYFLFRISGSSLALHETIGMISAYGMACGLSINNAHELGHRNSKFEKILSKSLLMTSLYMHFFIEHNRGHHLHVATEEDPASSRLGENIYAFFIRSITGSYLSAWSIENKQLRREGKKVWSLQNEMMVYHIIQCALLLTIAFYFGYQVLFCFITGAFIGILMLEAVNYIEHYGLSRKKTGKRYERALPIHSWNSNHPVGRMILLELSRHSDHHFMANRKYQLLRHFEESPQMPTGYPGMMLLALFPPLWFRVMHRRIAHYPR